MNTNAILLDTCAALWIIDRESMSSAAQTAIIDANEQQRLFVSPITAWEIGLLVSRGRLALSTSPLRWFQGLLADGIQLAPMTPEVLIDSSSPPGELHRDPADRIIVTTARHYGYRIVTRDRDILAYGEHGHVAVLAC